MYVVLYANKDIGSLRKKHDFGFVISCFVCLCYQLINEYGLQESNRVVKWILCTTEKADLALLFVCVA